MSELPVDGESKISTIGGSAACADDRVADESICWLEEPWISTLRDVVLVLEALCFFPAQISSKVGAPWPMKEFSDGGAYAIGRLLLLMVGGAVLGTCQIIF